jgi:glutamate--cysteine ligase catalytic subunit
MGNWSQRLVGRGEEHEATVCLSVCSGLSDDDRRLIAKAHMDPTEYPITMTSFPLLGLPGCTTPSYPNSGPKLRSQFLPDEIANPHIRFPTLAANIRSRRGRKVQINVPVFRDQNTPWPFWDPTVDYNLSQWPEDQDVHRGAVKENCVYMDAMAFGMGSCCLQITFQAKNIDEGRRMYDQLVPLGPILLAMTAATPIYKGFLVDTDVRWNQISAAVDDRTAEELGERPLKDDRFRIPKSRYAPNSTYISPSPRLRSCYLDSDLVYDTKLKQRLVEGGMDDLLATHFAHLFIRDPLVIFSETLNELDLNGTDHFENLQSTNWQHMRFKPPPPPSQPAIPNPPTDDGTPLPGAASPVGETGWRVEFRPMEIQPTDEENAAFAIFVLLVTRAILSFDLNFYVPIARVTENMARAHQRDANLNTKFWWRKNVFDHDDGSDTPSHPLHKTPQQPPVTGEARFMPPASHDPVEEYTEMTVEEIICGPPASSSSTGEWDTFPGLIPLVEAYLSSINIDVETRCHLARYFDFLKRRADGRNKTPAKWMREFVRSHPEYKGDSVVGEGIQFDLVKKVVDMGEDALSQ